MREWQVVTVALAASSSAASGLPTRSERPTTTASAPSSSTSWRRSSSITPVGVHGRRPGRPLASRPAEIGVRPSTSLRPGRSARSSAAPSTCGGVGSWSRMPETAGSVVELAAGSARPPRGSRPAASRWSKPSMPTSAQARCLPADVDGRGGVVADQDRGEAGRAVAGLDPGGDLRAHLLADLLRDRLPVDDLRRHCRRQATASGGRRQALRERLSARERRETVA